MKWVKENVPATALSAEQRRLVEDIRKAEQELTEAEWRFHHALGEDYVDYAVYCLEAAEKKLGMLLKQAKWHWGRHAALGEKEGTG
ncbi:DUF2508 domain-containing protein [Cohnella suwonensis]|uniref:DUF2508 domain-containing protein n=1 Tax=Cohnella suwonensis TaxID=696072 RepID=A0ABW0LPY6_9BACL